MLIDRFSQRLLGTKASLVLQQVLWINLLAEPTYAIPTKSIRIDQDFRYELQLSDVGCWRDRWCRGLVTNNVQGNIAQQVDDILARTQDQLDLAIYGIRRQDWLLSRIKKLKRQGVKIRVTLDQKKGAYGDWETGSNFPYPDAFKLVQILGQRLVRPDRNKDGSPRTASIMHNKFFVQDQSAVWLGSTNFSNTGTGHEYNANSSLIIYSKAIAKIYSDEFNQMYEQGHYGRYKSSRSQQYGYRFRDGTRVSVYFSPQDSPRDHAVIPFIDRASRFLDIGMFYLTSVRVADALIRAHNRGVKIRIINDATAARNLYSLNKRLRRAGIDVRVENWGGKMHMKTAVSDQKHILIGSMNWSKAGSDDNDENTMIIENNPKLASEIIEYFDNLWVHLDSSLETPNYHSPRPESHESINSCEDGINNDHVGGYDRQVFACR